MKAKVHKSTAKRLKLTGSGKITRNKQSSRNNSHLVNMRKSTRKVVKGNLEISSKRDIKKVKKLLNK